MRTDQVTPALIEGTRQHRRERNMMETMSKRNYVIGVREPISGDRSPRRYRNRSDECPLPVVKKNGVGKSSEKERSVTKRKEAIVTGSALTWVTTFRQNAIIGTTITMGTFSDFITKCETAFKHHDITGTAIAWLSTKRMTKGKNNTYSPTLIKYVSHFKNYSALASITN